MGEKCVIYVEKYEPRCYLCGNNRAEYKVSFWYYEMQDNPFKSLFLCRECYEKLKEFLPAPIESRIMDIILWVTERFTVPSWVYGTFMVLTAVIILGYELLLDHYRKRRG